MVGMVRHARRHRRPPGSSAAPILVTGAHRSGTTWTADVLAQAPGVTLVDEPFNPIYNPRRLERPLPHWFEYICADNEDDYVEAVAAVFSFRYPLAQAYRLRTRPEAERFVHEWADSVRGRWNGGRILCKDPIAVFSMPWLAERFAADVVACIRHPAAFASSLIRLGWTFDFSNWTRQPLFMRDCAGSYAGEIERLAAKEGSVLEQAILLWKVIYARVHAYQARFPEWSFVRHEDLSAHPVEQFEHLYARLGLDFGARPRRFLDNRSSSDNPTEVPPAQFKSVTRNSGMAARTWLGRLSDEEVARIRDATAEESEWFYSGADWLGH